jgi:hypothetical protein
MSPYLEEGFDGKFPVTTLLSDRDKVEVQVVDNYAIKRRFHVPEPFALPFFVTTLSHVKISSLTPTRY